MDPVSKVASSVAPEARPVNPASTPRREEAERVAREFEAVFLGTVVEEMLKTGQPATFGGGHAEEMWRSVMARAYADQITAAGGIGLAEAVATSIGAAASAYGKR